MFCVNVPFYCQLKDVGYSYVREEQFAQNFDDRVCLPVYRFSINKKGLLFLLLPLLLYHFEYNPPLSS
jgi:hypothetical protein